MQLEVDRKHRQAMPLRQFEPFWPVRAPLTAQNLGAVRREWMQVFGDVRAETERRAAPLSDEDQLVQSMPDASPTKWHRAHTTWFFEQFVLAPNASWYCAYDASYAFLFNSYYVA